jgi:UDP-glucose 4-epimerase
MQLEKTQILITGGAGFIGSELVRQVAPRCARVVVVDNLVNGRRENLSGIIGGHVELVAVDVRDRVRISELLQGIDIVFHLACLGVRHSIHSPRENHDVNATATLDLLRAARQAGVQRLVYTSSSEVYGTAKWAPMTEDHPTFPMTVYGASKLAGECYVRAFHRTYDYPAVVVRPFNAYGPRCHHEGDSGEVIPKFMLRCLAGLPMVVFGDGSQTRDFTYVADTARGIIAAAGCDAAIGQTINLGSGAEITINNLARAVAAAAGQREAQVTHDIPRPGDVLRLYADSRRAQELLGFAPTVGFSEGLAKLRDWYRASGRSPEELLEAERVRNWEVAAQ